MAQITSCDLAVIGAGMTGMAATMFASNRGLKTVQIGVTGEIIFASGFLDILGIHPISETKPWTDPWAGIAALIQDCPDHPYGRLTEKEIQSALEEYLSFVKDSGVPHYWEKTHNLEMLTPQGTLKLTGCVPQTMKNAVLAIREKPPGLIVDIKGLKGFSAHQIVDNLKDTWPDLHSVRIEFPDSAHLGEIFPEYMARSLESGISRKKLAAAILPHVRNAKIVGVPAILGIHHSLEVQADLENLIGARLFEIPTLPPSVPGLRLKEMFEKALPEKGVRQFLQQRVAAVLPEPDNGFTLDISGGISQEQKIRCRGILLATGRFFGKGLTADRKRVRESLFDLPVFQPLGRSNWYNMDFLDPKGHPIHQAGLEIDDNFRPLSASGTAAFSSLFAAGSILAHQDWIRQKCGSGLAIATAYGAVYSFIKLIKSS
ncbi:MAG: glycerol-3-phosphate dehydrogenase subunit GlpB [Desulfatirhabdiaceae bacterium]|nr:glycerol-3-phosphate dehydrogenase subunit GlpB [Desulfatirhabdiaceae bacterium]